MEKLKYKRHRRPIKIFILFFCMAAVTASSCRKKNDVIPDVTVDFYLDISDPRFVELNAIGGSVTVNSSTNNDRYAAGYAGSGIIITNMNGTEFLAYDRTCPHDYVLDGSVVRINIDQTGFATVVCPECKTVYNLLRFGDVDSGPGQYPLKNYRTSFDGRFIRVWNN